MDYIHILETQGVIYGLNEYSVRHLSLHSSVVIVFLTFYSYFLIMSFNNQFLWYIAESKWVGQSLYWHNQELFKMFCCCLTKKILSWHDSLTCSQVECNWYSNQYAFCCFEKLCEQWEPYVTLKQLYSYAT